MRVLLIESSDRAKIAKLELWCRNEEINLDILCPRKPNAELAARGGWDVMVVDLDSRSAPIFEVLSAMRSASKSLMMLSFSTQSDLGHELEIRALKAGADMHLTWPVDKRVFLARLQALKRWRYRYCPLTHGAIQLDRAGWRCLVKGQLVDLSVKEFRLLEVLMLEPDVVFSRDKLIDLVHGPDIFITESTLNSHVKRLRQKLRKAGVDDYIETIYGAGYVLRLMS